MNKLVFHKRSQKPLVTCYLQNPDLGMGARHARADVLHALRAEIATANPDTVLISAEHLSSRFRDAEIAQLARDFADYPCRIIVFVREHASRIASAYAQTVLAGRTLSFVEFCTEIFHPDNRYVRYRDTIEPWERAFGFESMRVFSLAQGANAINVLCKELIRHALLPEMARSYWDNKSLGASGTEALRQLSKALPKYEPYRADPVGRLKWLVLQTARYRIAHLIADSVGDRPQGSFGINEQNRELLQEIVNIDRQWLAARYRIEIGPSSDGGPLPNESLVKNIAEQIKARPWVKILIAIGALEKRLEARCKHRQ
jgi:hypothetical protein